MRMKRQRTYNLVGACIYCGETKGPLTTEHIISKGLGGRLLLPASTCHTCAEETGALEGRVTGGIFRAARRELGFPQNNRKAKAKRSPETMTANVDGTQIKLAPEDFPGLLLTFQYEDLPGILHNRPLTEEFHGKLEWHPLPGFSGKMGRFAQTIPPFETISFGNQGDGTDLARMLAKIAHAYAIAEGERFRPYLTNIILNKPPMHVGHYVGGLGGLNNIQTVTDLHEIKVSDFWTRKHVVVEVQLFANRSLPVYVIVVGERM
jgi:HNH endonuclease